MNRPFYLLSIFFLFFLSGIAVAQPTLTASGYLPQDGEIYQVKLADYVSPAPAGADVSWDFSNLVPTDSSPVYYVLPSSTIYADSFPNATIASVTPASTGFFADSSDSYYTQGANGPTAFGQATVVYSDLQRWMQFPFNFTDTFTDSFAGSFTIDTITYMRKGSITVTGDAYGTLTLPDTMLNNVFRVKVEESYTDTYSGGFVSYSSVNYIWYYPGVHHPILIIGEQLVGSITIARYSTYLKNESIVLGVDGSILEAHVRLYPNPSSGIFYLETDRSLMDARAEVYSMAGRLVSSRPLESSRTSIDLRQCASGLYQVKIIAEEGVHSLKLMKD